MAENDERNRIATGENDAVDEILRHAPCDREELITILLGVQKRLGYLPPRAMEEIARRLTISPTDIWSVASFYNEFRFLPGGKYHVRVCLGTACHIKGGQVVMQSWKRKLGIEEGETTADRRFSLTSVGCVGCCSMAPVTVVNDAIHGGMSPVKVDGILMALDGKDSKAEKNE